RMHAGRVAWMYAGAAWRRRAPQNQATPDDLPPSRRPHAGRALRLHPVRRAGRAAGAVAPARRLGARACLPVRRADLVLRLDVPAHAPRESLPEARRGSRILRELHRTIPRVRHLSGRTEPDRIHGSGARRPGRERGDLRFDLPGSAAGSSRTWLRERSSEGASGPGREPGPESGAPGWDENGTHGRNPWTVRGRAHLPGLRRPAGRRRPDATLPTRAFL